MKREDSAVEISEYSHTIWAVISSQANTTAIDTTESRPANEVSNQVSLGGWGADCCCCCNRSHSRSSVGGDKETDKGK